MGDTNNGFFLYAAYATTWIAVIAYGLRLRRTRAEAERRLTRARESAGGLS
ncbi:MAG: CcmD family protein [Gemmatimonadaceae bacterium]